MTVLYLRVVLTPHIVTASDGMVAWRLLLVCAWLMHDWCCLSGAAAAQLVVAVMLLCH